MRKTLMLFDNSDERRKLLLKKATYVRKLLQRGKKEEKSRSCQSAFNILKYENTEPISEVKEYQI